MSTVFQLLGITDVFSEISANKTARFTGEFGDLRHPQAGRLFESNASGFRGAFETCCLKRVLCNVTDIPKDWMVNSQEKHGVKVMVMLAIVVIHCNHFTSGFLFH